VVAASSNSLSGAVRETGLSFVDGVAA